jgi:hypothetical protein
MYEIGIWEECIGNSGDDLMFAINIPQEAVTIPETVDGIRACTSMQTDRLEAVGAHQPVPGPSAGRGQRLTAAAGRPRDEVRHPHA